MKKFRTLVLTGLIVSVLAMPAYSIDAFGTMFGTLSTAQTIGKDHGSIQGGVGIADLTSVFGTFRYGFSNYTEGRIKVGLGDADGTDASIILGVDLMYQFWEVAPETQHPFDFAFGGFFEYGDFDGVSVLEVGGRLIGSYPFVLRNGSRLSPYAAINVRLESLDFEAVSPGFGGGSDSNIEFGLNGGVYWQLTRAIGVFGEFQIDGNDGLFLGIDFLAL